MSDQMLQPHYLKIHTRERGWVALSDMRSPDGSNNYLPRMFKDWWAANDEATKGHVASLHQCQIFPYYPEYAEGERAYRQRQIDRAEAEFARTTAAHEERLGVLIALRDEVPA